jgi:hypothetical protein
MSDSKFATTLAPSRRALIQAATACALPLPLAAAGADPALVLARRWSALEAEQRRLTREWQALETWLFQHRAWPELTDAERKAVPEAARMWAIEHRLAQIDRDYGGLLPQLKRAAASTRAGTLAKVDVLLEFLDEVDQPDARALLLGCRRDLRRLWI